MLEIRMFAEFCGLKLARIEVVAQMSDDKVESAIDRAEPAPR